MPNLGCQAHADKLETLRTANPSYCEHPWGTLRPRQLPCWANRRWLGMFGNGFHLVIYSTKQRDKKIHCGYVRLLHLQSSQLAPPVN